MNERCLIQPADMENELKRLMGCRFSFCHSIGYNVTRDEEVVRLAIGAEGRIVEATVSLSHRLLSLNDFSHRVLTPMVERWQVLARQEHPEGCVAGWISEEA